MSHPPFDKSEKCFWHAANVAATCRECYDLALAQQARQVAIARTKAHRQYLAERTARPQ